MQWCYDTWIKSVLKYSETLNIEYIGRIYQNTLKNVQGDIWWSGYIWSIYIWSIYISSTYIWSILHLVNLTFGQLLHLGILHFVHFTFRQLIQFVNCDNGLKFGQLSYLKAWFPLSQLEYQLNKSANIGTQTSQQLKISVSSQIQHGKLGSC